MRTNNIFIVIAAALFITACGDSDKKHPGQVTTTKAAEEAKTSVTDMATEMKDAVVDAATGTTETAVMATTSTASAETLASGKKVYESSCQACHATGAAGAPKLGDTANWAPRIAAGMDSMSNHAINGYQGSQGLMPPKGGFTNLSDDDVKAAVAYMASASK